MLIIAFYLVTIVFIRRLHVRNWCTVVFALCLLFDILHSSRMENNSSIFIYQTRCFQVTSNYEGYQKQQKNVHTVKAERSLSTQYYLEKLLPMKEQIIHNRTEHACMTSERSKKPESIERS